jgi:hypothetical protein
MLNDVLSNFDIQRICSHIGIKLNGIFMKDQVNNTNFKDGNYIMNLENSNQSGSHWVSFVKKGDCVYYSDSYGVRPPENIYNLFLNNCSKVYVNMKPFQSLNSKKCGWYAIYFLYSMNKRKGVMLNRFINFVKQWDYDNPRKNEVVKKIIYDLIYNA